MTIQQGITNSFKEQMLQGQQNLTSDTLKMALYTAFATLGPTTTAYTAEGEVSGDGYIEGGQELSNVTISSSSNGIVYVSFSNPSWPGASFTTRGALIYNVTQGDGSVAVLDFGADKSPAGQTFTVTLPANTATTALIRFP